MELAGSDCRACGKLKVNAVTEMSEVSKIREVCVVWVWLAGDEPAESEGYSL